MSSNNRPTRLPPELAAIKPPSSKEECLQFLSELTDPKDYIEKFKLHLTNEYFQQNILSFNLEELTKGLSYPYIKKKYNEREVLLRCINKDVVYPILFNCIINKNVPLENVYQYADILSRNGKSEELNTIYDYYQFTDNPILKLFKNTPKPSDALVETVIRNEPEYILQIKSWSDERVTNWIKENKEKSIDIISKVSSSTLGELPLMVQHALYDNLLLHFNKLKINAGNDTKKLNDVTNSERNILVKYPITYINYLQQQYPEYLDKKFKQRVLITHGSGEYRMNVCQFILTDRKFNSLLEIEKTFPLYTDLIKEKMIEKIGLFSQEISPLEYALKQSKYALLFPFNVNEITEEKEREMFLSIAFGCLPVHVNAKQKNHTHAWYFDMYPKVINDCTDEEFDKYYKLLKSGALIKELNDFKLLRDLNKMPTNDKKEKKIKI